MARSDQHEREERQGHVIAALRMSAPATALRLEQCAAMRRERSRSRWPWTCRSPGCQWCGPRIAARWWRGMEQWSLASGDAVSLFTTDATSSEAAVRTAPLVRRGLRDVRDRAAREDIRWRTVSFAGLVDANGRALVIVRHPSLPRAVVGARLKRRWPASTLMDAGNVQPLFSLPEMLAVHLAQRRRGVEPLRIVVMPQRPRQAKPLFDVPDQEPLPFLIG